MKKRNCWEFKKCGKELGGCNIESDGVCSASIPSEFSGTNGGLHNGRFCWAVKGTACSISTCETFENKIITCLNCDFFKEVQHQEGKNFTMIPKRSIKKYE